MVAFVFNNLSYIHFWLVFLFLILKFVNLADTISKHPVDGAEALKHIGVFVIIV